MVSRRFNQIELLASHVLCHFFPLFAGLLHWRSSGADEEKTIVRTTSFIIKVVGNSESKWPICVSIFSLVGIQRRISQGLKVLQYYTTKNWTFKNEKFLQMKEKMSAKDQKTFYFSVEEVWIMKSFDVML